MRMVYRFAAIFLLLGLMLSLPVLAVTISVKSKKSDPVMRAQPVRKIVRNAVDARGDWWMFRHDPQHTGRSSSTGPAHPDKKWECAIGSPVNSPVIGSDGTIYVHSEDGEFFAINPDGTKKWEFATGDKISSSPAIGSDGTINVGSYDKWKFYAINPDGTKKWEFYNHDNGNSSPAIGSDGTIYCSSFQGYPNWEPGGLLFTIILSALNPDGTEKWELDLHSQKFNDPSPAIASDGTIYVGTACQYYYHYQLFFYGNLIAINPDGTEKWKFQAADYIESSPAIGSDGTIYVGSRDKNLYAINPDGTKKWEFATGDVMYSSPAIGSDGTIYVRWGDTNLYAINPDGTKKWEFATGDKIHSSPAIDSKGTIYVGSDDGKFYAINPDGTKKWEFTIGGSISSPAIGSDGTIYVGSSDGKLYAIGPGDLATSISTPSALSTNTGPASYAVTYTNAATVTLSVSDITLNKTGTANGTVSVTGTGNETRTVTISNITGNGTLGISIAEGTAFNSSKTAPAAGPSQTFNVLNPGSAWSGIAMISMPIIPDATAHASNPNRTDPKIMVGFSDNNWFWFDPAANNYKQYPNIKTWYDPRTDAPYRGFWAKFTGTPAIPAGTIPDQTTAKTIHLLPGWNLIGQPFVSPVSWDVSKIRVKVNGADPKALSGASDIAGDYAWGWDNVNGKYYLVYDPGVVPGAVGVLQPWQAYWFMAKVECDLIIPAP